MGMNPDTNKFEILKQLEQLKIAAAEQEKAALTDTLQSQLVRPNGEPVPAHWTVLRVGQRVVVEGYTFSVAHIGESHLLLEPVGPVLVGGADGSIEGR